MMKQQARRQKSKRCSIALFLQQQTLKSLWRGSRRIAKRSRAARAIVARDDGYHFYRYALLLQEECAAMREARKQCRLRWLEVMLTYDFVQKMHPLWRESYLGTKMGEIFGDHHPEPLYASEARMVRQEGRPKRRKALPAPGVE